MIPNDLYIWKLTCCVFLNKREVFSRFFGKSNIFEYFSTCQTRSYDFWIMNAMCRFKYLFIVYFSFAPVISASIHRYVNYFDIQVLMMVTETETLTSTLHHNLFTYLDYVFFCHLHIYIYVYIYLKRYNSFKKIKKNATTQLKKEIDKLNSHRKRLPLKMTKIGLKVLGKNMGQLLHQLDPKIRKKNTTPCETTIKNYK